MFLCNESKKVFFNLTDIKWDKHEAYAKHFVKGIHD